MCHRDNGTGVFRRADAESHTAPHFPAQVLIVDDHPIVREGLAAQIALHQDLEVCGQAEGADDAIALLEHIKPDVVVIDISLKTGDGIELVKCIRAKDASIRILVWSMFKESLYASRALRAGAMGYVNKCEATREILQAIRRVLSGTSCMSEELTARLAGAAAGRPATPQSPIETLSDRELAVFRFIGHGLSTAQIAENMHLSPKTVETYRARIKVKLGLATMTELIQRATLWTLENR